MRYLALDVGRRHTGVAYVDTVLDVPLPLQTIHHQNQDELVRRVQELVSARNVETIIVGLPLLLSGDEGDEAIIVRGVAEAIGDACPSCSIRLLDERQTSKAFHGERAEDDHAQAALTLLTVALRRERL